MLGDFGSIWHLFCMSHVKRKVFPFCRSTQPDRQPTTNKIVSDQGTLTTKLTCSFPTPSSIRGCLILLFHVEIQKIHGNGISWHCLFWQRQHAETKRLTLICGWCLTLLNIEFKWAEPIPWRSFKWMIMRPLSGAWPKKVTNKLFI